MLRLSASIAAFVVATSLTAGTSNLFLAPNFPDSAPGGWLGEHWKHYEKPAGVKGFSITAAGGAVRLSIPDSPEKFECALYQKAALTPQQDYVVSCKVSTDKEGSLSVKYLQDTEPWPICGLDETFNVPAGEKKLVKAFFTAGGEETASHSIRFLFSGFKGNITLSDPRLYPVSSANKQFIARLIEGQNDTIGIFSEADNRALIQPGVSPDTPPDEAKWLENACDYKTSKWSGSKEPFPKKIWIRKDFVLPASWKGAAIELEVEVNAKAIVFINSQKAGEVDWPNDSLILPPKLLTTDPAANRLTIFMDCSLTSDPLLAAYLDSAKKTVEMPCVRDCILTKKSSPLVVKDIFIQPSVKRKELVMKLNTTVLDGACRAALEFAVFDAEDGSMVFSRKFPEQTFNDGWNVFSLDWIAPKLWDIGAPNLYYLSLVLRAPDGKELAAPPLERFGFREFEIEGKEMRINGHPMRLGMIYYPGDRPTRSVMRNLLPYGYNAMFEQGMQFFYTHQMYRRPTYYEYGYTPYQELCDEVGLALFSSAPPIYYVFTKPELTTPGSALHKLAQHHFYRFIRKKYNSPSIIAWNLEYSNTYWGDPQISPEVLGLSEGPEQLPEWKKVSYWKKATRAYRQLDPTRAYIGHNDDSGDIAAPFIFMNWMPEQEYLEYLSKWAANPGRPIMGSECGTPLFGGDILRREIIKDPLVTEYAAMRMGDKAYELETDEYTGVVDKYAEAFKAGTYVDGWDQYAKSIAEQRDKKLVPSAPESYYLLFPKETITGSALLPLTGESYRAYRHWRADGLNGGLVNWVSLNNLFYSDSDFTGALNACASFMDGRSDFQRLADFHPAIIEGIKSSFQPLLVFVAGAPDIHDRSHNFDADSSLEKQMIFLCDRVSPTSVDYEWSVKIGAEEIATNKGSLTMTPGSTHRIPIHATLPPLIEKRAGSILVTARSGNGAPPLQDHFDFMVFPKLPPAAGKNEKIFTFSLGQDVVDTLVKHGLTSTAVDAGAVPAGSGTLLIGSKQLAQYGSLEGLKTWVAAGNRLVILEQTRETLAKLGFRTIDGRSREVFIRDGAHPLVTGLDNADLSLWQGVATLLPATGTELSSYPRSPHWGNRNTVCSVSIETPHNGPFKPLLQCEFDLAYTPLLEMRHGKGEVLFCQLDLSNREGAPEPVVAKILSALSTLPPPAHTTRLTFYIGSPEGYESFARLGITAAKIDSWDLVAADGLLLIGENTPLDQTHIRSLKSKIESGCDAFILAQESSPLPELFEVSAKQEPRFAGARNAGELRHTSLAGVGPSELHWRAKFDVRALVAKSADAMVVPSGLLGAGKLGKGTVIQYQLPTPLIKEKGKVAEYTTWRQQRLVSQVASNLAARFDDAFVAWGLNGWFEEDFSPLQTWYAAGPFASKNAMDGLDRKYITFEEHPHCWGKVQTAEPGYDLEWRQFDRTGSQLFFAQTAGFPVDNGTKVAYFESFFESSQPGRGVLHLEVDWYAKVWLNGKEVLRIDRDAPPAGPPEMLSLGKDQYEIPLEKKNRIVIKVVSGSMGLSLQRVMIKYPQSGESGRLRSMYACPLRGGDLPYRHYRW